MRARIGAAVMAALLLLACREATEVDAADLNSPQSRAIMNAFYANLRIVLPATVGKAGFENVAVRPEVWGALHALATDAAVLAAHSREAESGARNLGRSLERDTKEILRQYERGHSDRAGFLLQQVTENCVVCHSRLPSPGDSPLAEHFVDHTVLARLGAVQRATLLVATRRFDEALTALEGHIESPDVHPALLLGPITDYLTICIRVKDDYARPLPVLERFARRADLWERLRLDVEAWIRALPALRARTRAASGLASAREILQEGLALGHFRDPRAGLVHVIAASALLQRIVDAHPEPGRDTAEAYYLLGLTETRIGRNYWVTQADQFLETAIRLAPHAPFARDAYGVLEEEILLSYEGSSWEEIPDDEAKRLAELRALIDER